MEDVLRGRVEDEVGQLVRDEDGHPVAADLVGRHGPEERPDLGDRAAGDELLRVRPDRGLQQRRVAVDVEVDRFGLRHAEQSGGRGDGFLAEAQGAPGEGFAAFVPVDAHDVPLERLPRDAIVLDADGRPRAVDHTVGGGDAEAVVDDAVGQVEAAIDEVDPVRGAARRGLADLARLDFLDEPRLGAGEARHQLDAGRRDRGTEPL